MSKPETTREELLLSGLREVLPALVAAVSLLERGGKKAAPSDKMFALMLSDYKAAIERGQVAWREAMRQQRAEALSELARMDGETL